MKHGEILKKTYAESNEVKNGTESEKSISRASNEPDNQDPPEEEPEYTP